MNISSKAIQSRRPLAYQTDTDVRTLTNNINDKKRNNKNNPGKNIKNEEKRKALKNFF